MSDYANDHDDNSSSNSRKRKAPGSGRGVASLTPDQLAKKRANDRDAQRAIRERTKNTIETLERRIHELTNQQPYQELQEIVRQKDAALAENEEMRRRLASALNILQPLLTGTAGAFVEAKTQPQTQPYSGPDLDMQVANVQILGQSFSSDFMAVQQPRSIPNSVQPPTGVQTTIPTPIQNQPALQNNIAPGDGSAYPSPFPSSDPDSDSYWHPNQHARFLNHREMQKTHELSENGDRLTFSFLMDTAPQKPQNHFQNFDHPPLPADTNAPAAWKMLPKHTIVSCPLDRILLDFLKTGHPDTSTPHPSLSNLLNPGPSSPRRPDPISKLMTDVISTFPNISGMPEKVATTFSMFLFMRWSKYPSPENYHRLPEWMAPRPSALFEPHPAWMDNIPWPRMRDRIIHEPDKYRFENWYMPFTRGLSVNWPGECLVFEGEEPLINPAFEAHIYRLDNWSLGPEFIEAFPELKGTCMIRDTKRK